MKIIRTILQDIDPFELGKFNYHEHAFQISPLLPDEDLTDYEKSKAEFQDLKASGFDSYLEATPFGLGREPQLVAKMAQATELKIVHTTGFHKPAHYQGQPEILNMSQSQMQALIENEVSEGFDRSNLKAGVIKAGVGEGGLSDFEKSTLTAAAWVNSKMRVPIMIHLDPHTRANQVLDLLEQSGADLSQVALAHADCKSDLTELIALAKRSVFLGFDRAARLDKSQAEVNLALFRAVIDAGYAGQILFGGDLARKSRYLAYGGSPGLRYLFKDYLPKLTQASSPAVISQILVQNPMNWLSFTP